MEQTISKSTARKQVPPRNKAYILDALADFDRSGSISIKEFAAKHQVSEATFYNWRKKYQSRHTGKANDIPVGFIPVSMPPNSVAEQKEPVFAEYRGIIFYQRVEPAYLKALLK
jgi:transposase-like protein